METQRLIQDLDRFDVRLFTLGGTPITLWDLGFIVISLIVLLMFTAWLKRWTARRLARYTHLDLGARQTIATLVRYVTLVIGFLVIIQAAGINLTTFNVLAGAVGVGVGFGLQNIASNFISGLIVMFERPVKLGDRVDIGGVEGSVINIGARATTVLTLDDVAAIVPNQKLITETVKNWQHGNGTWQVRIGVTAKYGNDPAVVREALLAVAAANGDVLKDPAPTVRLATLAGGALAFELRMHTALPVPEQPDLVSALNFALMDELGKRKIALKE
jgi:small-conductance mechanosensitive channel